MFERLPRPVELGIFAAMAIVCALVVLLIPKHDYALMFTTMPLFLVSCLMGFRRNQARLRDSDQD